MNCNVYYFPKTEQGRTERARMKAALEKLGQQMNEYEDGVYMGDESFCSVTYPKQGEPHQTSIISRLEGIVREMKNKGD